MNRYEIPEFKITELFQQLYSSAFKETSGGVYTKCPYTQHSTPGPNGSFRVYPDNGKWGTAVCPCGAKGTIWDLLEEYEDLPGWGSSDFDETILYVCNVLDIEPKLKNPNARPSKADQARDFYMDLLKTIHPIRFKKENEHYYQVDGQWLYRGLNPMIWYGHGVGMLSNSDYDQLLKKHKKQGFDAAGLKSWSGSIGHKWLTHGVLMLRRNLNNVPVGLAVRRYEEFAGTISSTKYVKNSNNALMEASSFIFGLRAATAKRLDAPLIYVTEGEFDALALQTRGLANVVATGSGQPSTQQLDLLDSLGKPIVFLMDNDPSNAGFRNGLAIAKRAGDWARYVFLPSDGEKMDPDTFAQAYGTNPIAELDRYTNLQLLMMNEPMHNGYWSEPDSIAHRYMNHVLDNPTVHDELHVESIALYTGRNPDYYRSWLFRSRNNALVAELHQIHNKPLRVTL